jgi:hypothetical protein
VRKAHPEVGAPAPDASADGDRGAASPASAPPRRRAARAPRR